MGKVISIIPAVLRKEQERRKREQERIIQKILGEDPNHVTLRALLLHQALDRGYINWE